MSLGGDLKISAIFVIFMVSVIGASSPILLAKRFSLQELLTGGIFMTVKSLSTGIVLGVSLMHLLPDSIEALGEQTDYPLAIAIAVFGIMLTLGVDQIALYFLHKLNQDDSRPAHLEPVDDNGCDFLKKKEEEVAEKESAEEEGHDHSHEHVIDAHVGTHVVAHPAQVLAAGGAEMSRRRRSRSLEEDKDVYGHSHRHLHVPHDCDILDEKLTKKLIIKAVILEIAIATHSVIIGFEYGALDSVDDLSDLKILFIAFVVHQFFEGISLGSAIAGAEKNFGTSVVVSLILFFALTFSSGILIGMFASSSSEQGEIVAACANALAAGILLHSAMIEMLAEDFFNPIFDNKPLIKLSMYCGLLFGFGIMAALAVWA